VAGAFLAVGSTEAAYLGDVMEAGFDPKQTLVS